MDPDPFFYIHITVYFLQALFTFLHTNIFYHTICLILCLQQTGEIDNLPASWGQSTLVVLYAGSTLLLVPAMPT
jgi:NADH:ubiquinone oxidoreductase subunit 6 (subunit J)